MEQKISKQTILSIILFFLIIIVLAYWAVVKNKANAYDEIMALVQEEQELKAEMDSNSEYWWSDEEAKNECVKSFWEHQDNMEKRNDEIRQRLIEIEDLKGFLLQS